MVVRRQMEFICERVAPKDYLSELLAARYWVNLHVPYFKDPRNVELMRDPTALIEEIHRSPSHVVRADCDEISQLLAALWLSAGHRVRLVTASFSRDRSAQATHVFVGGEIPGTDPEIWVVVDPVAGTQEPYMLRRITKYGFVEVG